MPAATVTGREQNAVFGNQRYVGATSIVFAANGDTWTIPGIRTVKSLMLTCTANTAFGFTVSSNVITLVSGGALTFRGGAIGL